MWGGKGAAPCTAARPAPAPCLGLSPPAQDGPPFVGPPHFQDSAEAVLISPPASCGQTEEGRQTGTGGGQTEGPPALCVTAVCSPVQHPPAPWTGPHYLLLDEGPDDPCHLISIHLHHRVGHLDPLVGIWGAAGGCQGHIGAHARPCRHQPHSSAPQRGTRCLAGTTGPRQQVGEPALLRAGCRSGCKTPRGSRTGNSHIPLSGQDPGANWSAKPPMSPGPGPGHKPLRGQTQVPAGVQNPAQD